jgi:hypothetical protein
VEEPGAGRGHFGTARRLTLIDGVGGRYFEDCNEAEPHRPGIRRGVAAYALDPEAAARLWQVSIDTLAG